MKVSTVLSVAFAMSGYAQAENTRGGHNRKLAHYNEDGLTKRQQRKKEIAAETGSTAQPEEMITLDEISVPIVEPEAVEEVVVKIEEVDAAGDVLEEMSMTIDVPVPPSVHDRKGPRGKVQPLEAEPEPTAKGEPEPEVEGKHHGKGKGKHGKTKDIQREGKPGSSTEGHKKNLGAKGPKK
jgi:hypothetical protein